jgi:hypothetical protein
MSTDGTPPPSIAPKRPVPAGAKARAAEVPSRPASGPVTASPTGGAGASNGTVSGSATAPATPNVPTSGTTSTAAGPSASAKDAETTTNAPSLTGRLKQAAQGAVEAARTVLPTKDEDEMTAAPTTTTPRPAPQRTSTASASTKSTGTTSTTAASAGPRRVRLAVARIDPWSVMKLSFLLSVAAGIMIVVAAAVVWYTLDGLHVFTSVNDVIATLAGSETFFNLLEYVAFKRVISLATMIAVVDIVILTALSTIFAFLYNIVAALVGGIHLTLTDD